MAQNKLAFVVGINAYAHLDPDVQLKRAVSDANAVGDTLQTLGFQVTRVTEHATLDAIIGGFQTFTSTIQSGDTVFFYFAGHGISLDDGNYLIPADIPMLGPNDERLAKRLSIPEKDFSQDIRNAGARVAMVVIDACRNNPFPPKGTRSIGGSTRGFARMGGAEGMFSLYSARQGQTALDRLSAEDKDPNSVFTRVFLKVLKTPGLNLDEIGGKVRDQVAILARSSGNDQVPAYYNDLINSSSIVLNADNNQSRDMDTAPAAKPQAATPAPAAVPAPDEVAWSFVGESMEPRQIEAFIKRFPQSQWRVKAEERLKSIAGSGGKAANGDGRLLGIAPTGSDAAVKPAPVEAAPPLVVPDPNKVAALEPAKPTPAEATPDAATNASVALCDQLAAAPYDKTRPAGTAGVELDAIDVNRALPACRSAHAAHPDDPRLTFDLARVLGKAGNREAAALFRTLADAGNASDMNGLGAMYAKGLGVARSDKDAAGWYQKAADGGCTYAMVSLGHLYEQGSGVTKNPAAAMQLYQKAADAGNAYGLLSLGSLYEDGVGVPKDEAKAAALYQKAADAGNAVGMNDVAQMYANGSGVAKDAKQALNWFQKAANAGDADGMNNLGGLYEKGLGVVRNPKEAETWYRKAAAAGSADARNSLKRFVARVQHHDDDDDD